MNALRDLRIFSFAALALVGLAGCGAPDQPEAAQQPREVETVTVAPEAFSLSAELPGRIEPVRVAQVRARVAGIVLRRNFEEGAEIKAGDLLFQIDPAPLKAAASRAQGELARIEAQLFENQAKVKRYEQLADVEAISRQDLDTARAALKSSQAAQQSARADLQTAGLNLGYATVRAPISGRIGRALVTEGALVGQGEATLMASIQQLDPIYADFTQPVAQALKLRQALKHGSLSAGDSSQLSLQVEGTDFHSQGTLLFSDVAVDRGTGQVSLRGRFSNPEGVLLPGMYVRVKVPQGTDQQALLVPQRAVQRGSDGQAQVLVVNADDSVSPRAVQTGAMQGQRWQITQGLEAGDRVIIGGQNGLVPGDKVLVKAPLAPAAQQQAARQ
ncbi:RND multidrug efflux membrane fusion protein MexC [Pseudomonas synxantha BG33R]|uniref:efflux RND transporter periplasmic adaptor subunit n=1 Tax=Pseudomonas synxantha TaxID=47883 RepID=UPI00025FF231|nr:efflux RND transporter periplasmic adaptor subunit [Pseudomonas synxantha]EIK68722.1 RND multidrug efflux membrane fusion protein MexC [Pseudomonas synxantha BG33R]